MKDLNTIDQILVTNGGEGYTTAPTLKLVDSVSRNVIDSGILKPILTGSAISSVNVESKPKGLPDETVEIFATNNTNGVAIVSVESSNSGIFTCSLSTPNTGIGTTSSFAVQPFNDGDKVYVEGIQKFGSAGDGFNSEDYGYKYFDVISTDFNTGLFDTVTISVSGLTTNTGTAKTTQDYSGVLINKNDYAQFEITQKLSEFLEGESLSSNGIIRDLKVAKNIENQLKVSGLYDLSVGEVITGTESGTVATIKSLNVK